MKKNLGLVALTLAIAFHAQTVHAQEEIDYSSDDRLSFGLGIYDIGDNESALDLRAEHRWGTPVWWAIKPFAGGEVTSDGTVWAGAGFYADFYVDDRLIVTPSIGAGLYAQGGSDRDLDHPIEFRSQIEAAYEMEDMNRVAVAVSHISNADLGDSNPGTEILSLYWQMPY